MNRRSVSGGGGMQDEREEAVREEILARMPKTFRIFSELLRKAQDKKQS